MKKRLLALVLALLFCLSLVPAVFAADEAENLDAEVTTLADPEAAEPEATEPEATEPEATEPEAAAPADEPDAATGASEPGGEPGEGPNQGASGEMTVVEQENGDLVFEGWEGEAPADIDCEVKDANGQNVEVLNAVPGDFEIDEAGQPVLKAAFVESIKALEGGVTCNFWLHLADGSQKMIQNYPLAEVEPGEPGESSGEPTAEPSGEPSGEASGEPTGEPSGEPSGEPTAEPVVLPEVSVTITEGNDKAIIDGDYEDLYVRVAFVLDISGTSGLYLQQVVINDNEDGTGTVVMPTFNVPGVSVKGINVAMVLTADDVQSPTPTVAASAFVYP